MSKGQNAFAAGALVLVAALFRMPVGQPSAGPISHEAGRVAAAAAEPTHSGEGPWIASCQYWAAVTGAKPDTPVATDGAKNGIKVEVTPSGDSFQTKLSRTAETQEGCGAAGVSWGIPDHEKKIHAILVALPDPVHSHLSLEFDREIDAILQSATNYGYISSNYWLPWRIHAQDSSSSDNSAKSQDEDKQRERQPGLIVMKKLAAPPTEERPSTAADFYDVLYLFLVAETPTLGMNGEQLHHALDYERELQRGGARLSLADDSNTLAFIGPRFSGSAASLQEGLMHGPFGSLKIVGSGTTSTQTAIDQLNQRQCGGAVQTSCLSYISFGENSDYEAKTFLERYDAGDADSTAILVEENTVLGSANAGAAESHKGSDNVLTIRFPREISLLRNALNAKNGSSQAAVPSPYLSLQIKDSSSDDVIPRFSLQSPAAVESQLMQIERQLQKRHIRKILLSASNILDEVFLAQELHRACPDAEIVFYGGGDLLFERDVDNAPYVGSLTVTPYDLITPDYPAKHQIRIPSDSQGVAVYNSANYVFGYGRTQKSEQNPFYGAYDSEGKHRFALKLTVVGTDGYYPLGMLSPCASDKPGILPDLASEAKGAEEQCASSAPLRAPPDALPLLPVTPALLWFILCSVVIALCLLHTVALWKASFWSSATRDLAVAENDQPYRRTVYIHLATATLACMAASVAVPFIAFEAAYGRTDAHTRTVWLGWSLALAALVVAAIAIYVTFQRTRGYRRRLVSTDPSNPTHFYRLFLTISWIGAAAEVFALIVQCSAGRNSSLAGVFFSYRCLHPTSGVSPLTAILLMQTAWYIWAMFQTARMRFGNLSRPRLPDAFVSPDGTPVPNQNLYFVSDQRLSHCAGLPGDCLYRNIDCFLLTYDLIGRYKKWTNNGVAGLTTVIYAAFFVFFYSAVKIHSIERVFYTGWVPPAFELIIAMLFYPLFFVALSGWLRAMLIWSSLREGLLEPLERGPLRFAFSRLTEVDWVAMLGQSGLHLRWKDMTRTLESLRQLASNPQISNLRVVDQVRHKIGDLLTNLQAHMRDRSQQRMTCAKNVDDRPEDSTITNLCYVNAIEHGFAEASSLLLEEVLIPYWKNHRSGYVNSSDAGRGEKDDSRSVDDDPPYIRYTEEFLAIRYVALIRMVLVNIRHLMIFVSVAFVLTIVAWNSYPFQPHRNVDWCFTLLIVILTAGFIWVFAQMHRDPILSRITSTEPNRLGWDFFLRLAAFGAVPVMTWLAYEFPEIGGKIFQLVQPSLAVK